MRKKRVLLLSEGFGAGHTQAAHALSVGLRMLSPGIQTRVLELGSFLHPTLAPWIFTAYRKTVTTQPKLYGYMYRSQYKKSLNRFTQLALHRIFYAQTAEIINQLRPDTIVCTHPFPNAVISRLKRAGLNVPLCTVITDYDAHGTWLSSEVNKYLVSTSDVRDKLLGRGINSDAIEVTGIPVHPNFWGQHNRDELRAQYGLKAMPTVLVMGGGWGLMNNGEMLHYFTDWREKIQLIICLGSNDKALAALSEDKRFQHENIRLMGFTNEIDKWMDVSDLLITKPGGMTCTEGLAKGIPMLFYNPIPGQEEENLQYFTQHGFGEHIKSDATIDHWLKLLVDGYPEVLKRRALLSLSQHTNPYNPMDCSQAIMEILNQ
ncbi:MGDG synthase family glycosyltransferase [Paenibacillus radicis (ex Xue et al. 2023)]|uniref:UDP-N-acetylglucosamine--LPS N-acetylglucosamine transferase n=1 Tax=Paenibacillus radicis (ex Xue et al. 2023) TaxID=2972489 RepID=A0ABT1YHA7_9BACL|nr:glycosyltransferase [Paenibacillus radicis (ex Xue et al. 2023)]MCR8632568.1 UDP-N-acetylglucosamine--LPS N-acetylglucosamine transferase [Paenibacillus radicis (ex Xue et al. 2023)]